MIQIIGVCQNERVAPQIYQHDYCGLQHCFDIIEVLPNMLVKSMSLYIITIKKICAAIKKFVQQEKIRAARKNSCSKKKI
jgi:hypothetical protein